MNPVVVKVGGSLLDWPELKPRLSAFLDNLVDRQSASFPWDGSPEPPGTAREGRSSINHPPILIVPGGGAAADVVREFDRAHRLGDEASHWLALRACTANGHLLARLLQDVPVIAEFDPAQPCAIVDLFSFAERDELRTDHWPHRWDVTSDSMAVRVAMICSAPELILLKSIDVDGDWAAASAKGHVDSYFPEAVVQVPNLRVRAVNLRSTSP